MKTGWGVILCLLASLPAMPVFLAMPAASAPNFLDCADIADPQARLACYDGAAAAMRQAPVLGRDPAAPPAPVAASREPESMTAAVVGVSYRDGIPHFRLANGQSWRAQKITRVRFRGDGSDKVTISPSLLGLGYVLTMNDSGVVIPIVQE